MAKAKLKSMTKIPLEITLEPTRLDASLGVCSSPTKCMYVLTARRIFPGAHIYINPHRVTVTLNGEYHYYGMPLKGVHSVAKFDKVGKAMTDEDLKKAKIALRLIGSKKCSYKGTAAEKEYHRKKSARYRAIPGYVRPDSKNTIRAQIARTYVPRATTTTITKRLLNEKPQNG